MLSNYRLLPSVIEFLITLLVDLLASSVNLIYKSTIKRYFMSSVVMVSALEVGKVSWKLRETMARRKITNKDLAEKLGSHPVSISRLKAPDILPAIGGEEIERIRAAINELSQESFGFCALSELVGLEEDES